MSKLGMSQNEHVITVLPGVIEYSLRQRDRNLVYENGPRGPESHGTEHRESHWYKINLDPSKLAGRMREKYLDMIINTVCDHADLMQDRFYEDDPDGSQRLRYQIGVTVENEMGNRETTLDSLYKLAKRADQLEGIAGDHSWDWNKEHGKMLKDTDGLEAWSRVAAGIIPFFAGGYLAYKEALNLANTYVTESNFPNEWAQEIIGVGGQIIAMVGGAFFSMFAGHFIAKKMWNGKFNRMYSLRERYRGYYRFREALIGNSIEYDKEVENPVEKRLTPEDFRLHIDAILPVDQEQSDGS